jgi:hypothetical protein
MLAPLEVVEEVVLNLSQTNPATRAIPVTAIAVFQFSKALFLLLVAGMAWLGLEGKLAAIPKLRDLVFLASHGKDPHGILLFVLGASAAWVGLGLWRLKRWARNTMVFNGAFMLIFWLAHQDFGMPLFVMPAAASVEHFTIYLVLAIDLTIFCFLKFHSGIDQSFVRKVKQPRKGMAVVAAPVALEGQRAA